MLRRHLPFFLLLGWLGLPPQAVVAADGSLASDFPPQFTALDRVLLMHGRQIYDQLCFACHGVDGRGTPSSSGAPGATMAPSLCGAKIAIGLRDGAINAVLKGISGPEYGKNYNAQMVPMQTSNDEWIAAVLSHVRNNFGNHAGMILPADVARVRNIYTNRLTPWTIAELLATLPRPFADRWRWKFSASSNCGDAALAIAADPNSRYDTRAPQAPDMWFQIRFPWETAVGGLVFDTGNSPKNFPRGYEVRVSDDGLKWSAPIASGHGAGARTEISFAPARVHYIRLTLTASAPGTDWSIHELQVLRLAPLAPQSRAVPPKASIYE